MAERKLTQSRRIAVLALAMLTALTIALLAADGGRADRTPTSKAGASLFGIVEQGGFNKSIDLPAMKTLNVASVRFLMPTYLMQADQGACTAVGGACDWSGTDAWVGAAAATGAKAIPFIVTSQASNPFKPPLTGTLLARWKEFLTAAVQRYGPGGAYWSGPFQQQFPGSTAKPVKIWQIWNEPGSPTYFAPKPSVAKYAKLLKLSAQAIHRVHKQAQIMLAGLFASPDRGAIRGRIVAVKFLEQLYRIRGAGNLFDVAAVHPYSRDVKGVVEVVEDVRDVMADHGDRNKKLSVSELGWSSNRPNGSLLAKGRKGQANTLRGAFRQLVAGRTRWHLFSVNWFSLRDIDPTGPGSCPNCPYAGLMELNGKRKPSFNAFRSFTR